MKNTQTNMADPLSRKILRSFKGVRDPISNNASKLDMNFSESIRISDIIVTVYYCIKVFRGFLQGSMHFCVLVAWQNISLINKYNFYMYVNFGLFCLFLGLLLFNKLIQYLLMRWNCIAWPLLGLSLLPVLGTSPWIG